MSDYEPFKIPKLGRFIARLMTTSGLVDPERPDRFDYQRALIKFAVLVAFIWLPMTGMAIYGAFSIFGAFFVESDTEQLRWLALSFTALLAALAGLIGAPLALIRVFVSERQTKAAEEGLITDRFTKAIEQLGAEKTVYKADSDGKPITEPNLEVRLGAIYALERIAQDSERDHIPIMETLCAYIRQNTNEGEAKDFPLGGYPPRIDPDEDRFKDDPEAFKDAVNTRKAMIDARRDNLREWANSLGPQRPPRDDVRTALTVIERRQALRKAHEKAATPPFRINITRANLQRADLSGADLTGADAQLSRIEGANLSGAKMEGAILRGAKMEGAILRGAKMEGADLSFAEMEGADLSFAEMEGANLSGAKMEGANLWDAKMEGANLSGAEMEGANLWGAKMEGANLGGAKMEGANLGGAKMEGAILRGAKMEGAILRYAEMEGANLRSANLKSADLQFWTGVRTNCRSADFTGAKNMTPDQVNSLFGDDTTKLPDYLMKDFVKPRHWADKPLKNAWDDDTAYEDWIARGAPVGD